MSDPSQDTGDPRAQQKLYTAIAALAIRYARKHTLEGEADEIAHEIASKLLTDWIADPTSIDQEGSLAALVYKSVMNHLWNANRAANRRSAIEFLHGGETALSRPGWSHPLLEWEGEEAEEMYRRAKDALAPRTREVYLILEATDASYEEIATQLGITVGTVHWHVSVANKALEEAATYFKKTGAFINTKPKPGRRAGGTNA